MNQWGIGDKFHFSVIRYNSNVFFFFFQSVVIENDVGVDELKEALYR